MLGEYDASSVSFKVTTHARSFGHGSYAPFKSKNAFVEESSVSLTLWLKEKKLPCDVRPFYRSFVIEQLSKHGKLWAVQDNTLVWAYATVQSYSEMVEHANGKLGIDVDFLLYEGVWHKADKQKTFLHPYDLCTFMDCFDYKEYQPCRDAYLMSCGSCEEINIDPQTKSGSIVEIEKVNPHDAVESMDLDIFPQQDLNGYDHPWAGGAGKNKLPVLKSTTTINTVTFTVSSDGTITANGTPTANTYFYFLGAGSDTLNVPDGEYILTGCTTGGSSSTYYLQANNGSWRSDYGSGVTFTSTSQNVKSIGIAIKSGVQVNNLVFKPMLRLSSESDATWEPYTNICPITGFSSANIYVSPTTSVGDATTYNVSFGSAGTVYGGTLDVVSGQLTVTHAMLTLNTAAMNNSESYPGWKASGVRSLIGAGINQNYQNVMLNVGTSYSINTNSSNDIFILPKTEYNNMSQSDWIALAIDVQAIIPLATPLIYQVSPEQVKLLMGENYIWSDISDITMSTTGYHRDASDGCLTSTPNPHNDRYCCECDCDNLSPDMALCYHLDDLQEVYKECSNAGFRVVYDCEAAERFFNIIGQRICTDNCSSGTLAGKIYSETDIPTDGITITLVGNMHNPYVEINGNGNWIAGDYNGRLRIESNGEVYYENGCKCDDPLEPDVWQIPKGMNYGWTVLPRYNRVVVNLGACCGKACAYFNIDNLTI